MTPPPRTKPMGGRKLTKAQLAMLHNHDQPRVEEHGMAWTSHLGSIRTWRKLYDMGLLRGGRLTPAGRAALEQPQ